MQKFLQYFYILSKLSTSIMLFIALIFAGYLLYSSYYQINQSNDIDNEKLSNIINLVENNKKEIVKISNNLNKNFQLIELLEKNLENKKIKKNESDQEFNDLSNQLIKMEKNIINLENKIDQINNVGSNSYISNDKQLDDVKKILFFKFLNNLNIDDEIEILYKISNSSNNNHLEKILILNENTYFNFNELVEEFNILTNEYLKQNILIKNDNYFLNILYPIINVKPSNKSLYENQEIQFLNQAEEFLISKNFTSCIKNLKMLKFSNNNLDNFLNKIEIYSDFEQTLNMIK